MSSEPTYKDIVADVLETEKFEDELYKSMIDVAINRLESQSNEISEGVLLQYIQNLFKVPSEKHRQAVNTEYKNSRSETCLLKVYVEKAENVASKDVDGSSDPYCMVSVVSTSQMVNLKNGKYSPKRTKVQHSTLNPEWKEYLEVIFPREDVNKSYFQLQMWDYDGESDTVKKVKGVKGVKR